MAYGRWGVPPDTPDIAALQNGNGHIELEGLIGKVALVMGSFSNTFNTFSNALSPVQTAIVLRGYGSFWYCTTAVPHATTPPTGVTPRLGSFPMPWPSASNIGRYSFPTARPSIPTTTVYRRTRTCASCSIGTSTTSTPGRTCNMTAMRSPIARFAQLPLRSAIMRWCLVRLSGSRNYSNIGRALRVSPVPHLDADRRHRGVFRGLYRENI